MPPMGPREYDIVILGATGYTAAICSEYIVKSAHLSHLRWAITGRSFSKLSVLEEKLKAIGNAENMPRIEVVDLEDKSLNELVARTRLVVNGIGPYHLYSTPVVEACAKNGTHYVGFSLETPWVEEMIAKYHEMAKENGAMMILTIALAPADLVAYLVAKKISEQTGSKGTAEVNSTAKIELQGMSGGSLSTVLNLMSTYGISWILPGYPWSLTDVPRSSISSSSSLFSRIFGYRHITGLGVVTTSFLAICNESIVHRSASLQPELYGKDFHFHEYLPVSNFLAALLVNFVTRLGVLLFALPPFRWLFAQLLPAPGTGPDLATADKERQEFKAIGIPVDSGGENVMGRFVYEGSLYFCSAFMGVEAAAVMLAGERTAAHGSSRGILTSAMLGMPFIERLRRAGANLEVETLHESTRKSL